VTGSDFDQRYLSTMVKVLEDALATVDQLQPQAKKALRQQLGSVLARDHKVLQEQLAAARSLSSTVAERVSRDGQPG
jgi:predicted outer membrane protein